MSISAKLAAAAAAGQTLTLNVAETRQLHEGFQATAEVQADVLSCRAEVITDLRRDRADIRAKLQVIADAIHGTLTDEEIVEHAYRVTGEAQRQALHGVLLDNPALRNAAEELQDLIDQLAEHDNIVTRVQLRRLDREMFGLGIPMS